MWVRVLLDKWIARRRTRERAVQIYEVVVEKARDPFLFEVVNLPDIPQGRFESIVLHMFLIQRRFQNVKDSGSLPQKIMDSMAEDFDRSIREMGVGDLSVGKNVKKLSGAVHQRLNLYEAEFDDKQALGETLKDIFQSGAMEGEGVRIQKLAAYVKNITERLIDCSDQELLEGNLTLNTFSEIDLCEDD